MTKATMILCAALMCSCDGGSSPTSTKPRSSAAPSSSARAATPATRAASSSSSAAADGVLFGSSAFKVGDKITSKVSVGAGPFNATYHFETEILAVKNDWATQRRVKFIEARSVDKPLPVEGKSYVIETIGREIKATAADGGSAPKEEQELLGMGLVAQPDLPKRPIKPGDLIQLQDEVKAIFEKRDGPVGVFTYTEAKDGQPETRCESRVSLKEGRYLSIRCRAAVDGSAKAQTTIEHTYH